MPNRRKGKEALKSAKPIHTPEHKRVCEFLREARHKAGMTQEELATIIGWWQKDVSLVETGERRLDVVELVQISRGVGFDPCDLVRAVAEIAEEPQQKRRQRPIPGSKPSS